ncbi:hypothetical protein QQF21_21815 [Lelliottia sp. V89_10]|uniref:hypothetical protein n=1 Tax=Lelliottia wanjuensis TaxID=3050585 RepID=UPI00249D9898|nr:MULTISPECIES: hypothetical protein [unclassified Lelliottia]MDI3360600.1 hypothetical protein [Lelliottia sp. V89_13]MDK9550980.1 hypothetical protein [Lelliottia sp. V89_5]MDK9598261.1 hypothetical protein [Lelliottia sp. V89_10]
MYHLFLEFDNLEPGVKSVEDLKYVIRDDKHTAFVMSAVVARFIKDALIMNQTITSLKNCRFAFANGAEFVEFDSKGQSTRFTDTPDWFITPGAFARSQWLVNHELHDLMTPQFISTFLEMFSDVKKRREHCNLLFDLQLEESPKRGKPGVKAARQTRGSTKQKISDLGSFELFSQFFTRLKKAVEANQFPTVQVLTDIDEVAKVPAPLKSAVRTWFKAISSELPPNSKRVGAGNAALFCAPVRAQIQHIEAYGVERYYKKLSKAIADGGERYIADFTFKL